MLPIDSRQRLVLLKVRDKEILLGITQHGIESLGNGLAMHAAHHPTQPQQRPQQCLVQPSKPVALTI